MSPFNSLAVLYREVWKIKTQTSHASTSNSHDAKLIHVSVLLRLDTIYISTIVELYEILKEYINYIIIKSYHDWTDIWSACSVFEFISLF